MDLCGHVAAYDRGRRKGGHCRARNPVLAKIRQEIWHDTEGTACTISTWLYAICGALWAEHTGRDVPTFLRQMRYRPGLHSDFPDEDSPAELWLYFRRGVHDTEEFIQAGRVLARACRRWPTSRRLSK